MISFKMKSLYLVPLVVCTWVQAAQLFDHGTQMYPTDSVIKSFQIKDGHLTMLAPNSDFSKDDQMVSVSLKTSDAVSFNALEEMIRDLLDGFRDIVIDGSDDVPPLDPLEIATAGPFQVELLPGTRAKMTVRNFNMDGLRWYVVDDVSFNPLRLTFGMHITLPWLTVTGKYEAEAKLGPLVLHRAGGNFRLFINRFELGVDMRLGTNLFGGHLLLRTLDIKIDIQDVNIHVDGMVGSTLINAAINNLVQGITQELVQNQMENLSQMLSNELFDVINEALSEYTLGDLLS